jgi:hypothetical protein
MSITIVVKELNEPPFVLTERDEVIVLQTGAESQLTGSVGLRGPQGESAAKGFGIFIGGAVQANEILLAHYVPYSEIAFTVANCKASAQVAATSETIFTIKANGLTIGTITFAASSVTGVVNFTDNTVVQNQLVSIHAPAIVDATLSDVSFLLV